MKRRRALEVGETSQENLKSKKQRTQVRSSKNDDFVMDSSSQSLQKNSRKKFAKSSPLIKNAQSSIVEYNEPEASTSTEYVTKRKRKSKLGDINQNGEGVESIQRAESNSSSSVLQKRKKNGWQTKSSCELSSEQLQTSGDYLNHKQKRLKNKIPAKMVMEDNENIISPIKKPRQKKKALVLKPDEDKSRQHNSTVEETNADCMHIAMNTSDMKKQIKQEQNPNSVNTVVDASEIGQKKSKKKVRIDETESLKVKKEIAEAETHFSAKQLPAKIIKSKSNKNLTEEVKVSPLTVQSFKKEKKNVKKIKPGSKVMNKDGKSILHEELEPDFDENARDQDACITSLQSSFEEIDSGTKIKLEKLDVEEDDSYILSSEIKCELEENGIDQEGSETSEDSDLEVFYINKNAEKEAKIEARNEARKNQHKKSSITMPQEDQLILIQRMQDVIPDGDTKSYKFRLQKLEWQKIAFKNYTLEECQMVWTQLLKKVRHYRLLIEIIQDAKKAIENTSVVNTPVNKKPKATIRKHPDMPKRPLTSYFLYYIRKRDQLSKEKPEVDTVELNKYISEKYQNLPAEKKRKYEILAAKNREEYKRQLEEFYVKHPELRRVGNKKMNKEKPPKRPANPFRLFMESELTREEIAEEDKPEFKEVCKEKWRQMPDSKKIVWIKLAEDLHMKYEEDIKEFKERHPEFVPKGLGLKQFLSREELNLKDKLAGKPKKPPTSAYSLFLSMTMHGAEIADIPPRQRWLYTSAKWKAMSDQEREEYKQLFVQAHEQYQMDFKAYLDSLPEDKRQEELLKSMPKAKKRQNSDKPSTSGKRTKANSTKSASSRPANIRIKVENPVPPPRTAYKFFAEKYGADNAKEAWKNLSTSEKGKYEEELSIIKHKYIKDFELYLKSLTKDELDAFCANRSTQEEGSSSEESAEESDHVEEESSDGSSANSDSENETDEN